MLEQTFLHIAGIGPRTERSLWRRGILTWHDYLARKGRVFSPGRDGLVREALAVSTSERNNIRYFTERLPGTEWWRLFPEFSRRAVYLDIETCGGHHGVQEITVIGVYDGFNVRTFVNGIDLDDFEAYIAPCEIMVTFNGTCFDVPVIRRRFPHISLPPAHIDLRFLLKRLGYRGGLKRIEKELGVEREPGVKGLDGYDAVLLWKAHEWGDPDALGHLIQYNTADIVNLKSLMEAGYREMKIRTLGRQADLPGRAKTHDTEDPS